MDAPIQVHRNLYLSDIGCLSETDTSQFSTTISVCQDTADDNVREPYLHYPMADDMRSKESYGGSVDYQTFCLAVESVTQRLRNEKVVVHCHMGRNRSVAVCVAAMATHYHYDTERAIEHIQDVRPEANMSPLMEGFARQYVLDH